MAISSEPTASRLVDQNLFLFFFHYGILDLRLLFLIYFLCEFLICVSWSWWGFLGFGGKGFFIVWVIIRLSEIMWWLIDSEILFPLYFHSSPNSVKFFLSVPLPHPYPMCPPPATAFLFESLRSDLVLSLDHHHPRACPSPSTVCALPFSVLHHRSLATAFGALKISNSKLI